MLQQLDLTNNKISGNIPNEIGALTKLQSLDMSVNNLSGNIPKEISALTNLQALGMSSNDFSGYMPREIGNLTVLQTLYLSTNKLSGPIPSTFWHQSGLVDLALGSNNLSGEIPPSICNLRSLQVLYLSDNNLEGSIPDCMGNLSTSLVILPLNENKLSGLIPSSTFTKGCSLQSINLDGNKLEGTLPQTLVNCQDLQAINIGDNEIRDVFPVWMETLPLLRIYILRLNKFDGAILGSSNTENPFPKLQVLDVSHNVFVGSLPDRYFKHFRGMIDSKENYTDDEENLFVESISLILTLKGLDQLLERLLTTFTIINLYNHLLEGQIPQSNQLSTFGNESYMGNAGLCGFPLTRKCDRSDEKPSLQQEDDGESGFVNGFGWQPVVLGYGCGFIIGVFMGCGIIHYERPRWLLKFIFG
ncbi:receptor-like protein Cf-9 homolog [Salvia splendens]|uniref:receptor-like protein Cf-9 homolog n=1 Tax=Salvia splendens TaxID=180675 RepID=UPI001C259C7A|nr:receptor-like protein Cf-9 homolog [Salvia splendens]